MWTCSLISFGRSQWNNENSNPLDRKRKCGWYRADDPGAPPGPPVGSCGPWLLPLLLWWTVWGHRKSRQVLWEQQSRLERQCPELEGSSGLPPTQWVLVCHSWMCDAHAQVCTLTPCPHVVLGTCTHLTHTQKPLVHTGMQNYVTVQCQWLIWHRPESASK